MLELQSYRRQHRCNNQNPFNGIQYKETQIGEKPTAAAPIATTAATIAATITAAAVAAETNSNTTNHNYDIRKKRPQQQNNYNSGNKGTETAAATPATTEAPARLTIEKASSSKYLEMLLSTYCLLVLFFSAEAARAVQRCRRLAAK